MPTSGSQLPSDVVSTPAQTTAQPQVMVQIQVPQQSTSPSAPVINQTAINQSGIAHPETPVSPSTGVTISVQGTPTTTPNTAPAPAIVTAVAPTPVVPPTTPVPSNAPTPPVTQPKIKHSMGSVVIKWVLIMALTAQGLKGFFDSLYFIMVEFQNFEKGVSENLAEPSLMNQLMTKAALLIFATALSFFFSLQLTLFQEKGPGKLKMLMSLAIGISCFFVLNYANTINVVDVFK